MKKNCWEVKNCGRQPGGDKVKQFGVCPAALEVTYDKRNCGKNGGRACWRVAGTVCEGTVQSTFASKIKVCSVCEFYKIVKEEEGNDFKI